MYHQQRFLNGLGSNNTCLFRLSSYWGTCDSHFNPDRHLTISDLVFMPKSSPKYMLVRLKVSKTNPFRKGQTIVIGRANSNLCPIFAMVAYLSPVLPFPTQGLYLLFNLVPFLLGADLQARAGFYFQREGLIQANLLVTVFA